MTKKALRKKQRRKRKKLERKPTLPKMMLRELKNGCWSMAFGA